MSTSVPPGRPHDRLSLDSLGTELRPVLLTMAGAALLMIIVVLLSFTETGTVLDLLTAVVIGVALLVAAWLVPGARLSPLDPAERADPARAARILRATGLLAMVLAELPALVGLVMSFVVGGWFPALAGGVLGTTALLFLGPTRARLTMWKDRLEAHGARTGL